ncbi:MAG: cytochrome-c peroxidase [Burkholderiaceae bacterium]
MTKETKPVRETKSVNALLLAAAITGLTITNCAVASEIVKNPLAELGRAVFFDESLSEPAGVSCASCHDPDRAFSGDNGSGIGVSSGAPEGSFGFRKAPTLKYLATLPALGWGTIDDEPALIGGMFWDGRASSFETQALGPLFSPHEMNNSSPASVASRLQKAAYSAQLKELFGADIFSRPDDAVQALATSVGAFQRLPEFAPFTSKFDAVVRGEAEFTEAESRGLDWFTIGQKGNCLSCHTVDIDSKDPRDSLFTNFAYHALGAPRNRRLPATQDAAYNDLGLCETLRQDKSYSEPDKYCGFFRVPTLRNVALTGPYMHNGVFKTLREAVAFYATRDTDPQQWYPEGEKFNDLPVSMRGNVDTSKRPYHRKKGKRPALKDEEVDDLVAFLNTLTDGYQPASKSK